MRINPDQTNSLVATAIELRNSGDSSRSHRVIAAQRDRHLAGFKCLQHEFGMLGARCSNFLQILGVWLAFFFLLGDSDRHIAAVFNHVTERLQPRFQAGNADSRWPHIHPAARLAQVEGNADDAYLLGRDAGDV